MRWARWTLRFLVFACVLPVAVMNLVQLQDRPAIGSVCSCKLEIKGRQLYASLCQSSSINGPVEQECLYR